MADFSIIQYISGLTGYAFDKTVLERIALDCGVAEVCDYTELTQEQKDRCKMALLQTALDSPNTIASSTNQHGAYTTTIGQQIINSSVREEIKAQLRKLYSKYDMADELAALDDGNLSWIDENEY